jgi:hypothetical protein
VIGIVIGAVIGRTMENLTMGAAFSVVIGLIFGGIWGRKKD